MQGFMFSRRRVWWADREDILRREAEALPLKASILPWVTTILVVGRSLYCMTISAKMYRI
jgi:hypothetical protein